MRPFAGMSGNAATIAGFAAGRLIVAATECPGPGPMQAEVGQKILMSSRLPTVHDDPVVFGHNIARMKN